ncbi:MAG TPA: hypothetical protein VLD67_16525 [Vicinamibacterales bacterium]|nr:hypothetical protein [Vicinamibacterales bacterium]
MARAVQQFHTYPPTSPLCRSAVEACQRALASLARDQIAFRVAPDELIVDEAPVGRGTLVEIELARRLHAAAVAQGSIEQAASVRELTHFCSDLIACTQRASNRGGLIELLAEHGVDRITLRPAYRPEVLDVGAPTGAAATIIGHQREQRERLFEGGGHVDHLYPPDKGWVRLDPSTQFPSISLIDLALLADDPAALARMLVRLTDDGGTGDDTDHEALTQKYSDVATLFAALDPSLARVMFSKLARAVLDLDIDRRQALLRRTILPGLLDGRIDGTVLRDFPDVDLAESLCLLLDLETAAPEVVTTALARLDLAPEREAAVVPLIERRLSGRDSGDAPQIGLDAHARRLVKVDHERGKSFAEFAAFDLALDPAAVGTLEQIKDTVTDADGLDAQLACLWSLTRLEPNPELVERFVGRATELLNGLEREARWQDVATWLARYRELEDALHDSRPDVAGVISQWRASFCTPERAQRVVELAGGNDESRATAGRVIDALGPAIGPALLAALQSRAHDARDAGRASVVQLLCDHAQLVAPALVEALGHLDTATERVVARVLGLAGRGYEAALGGLIARRDEQTVREALRGLARIGSPQAAALVRAEIEKQSAWAAAAEQTLWHFPPAQTLREMTTLLARREFLLRRPDVAGRILDRVAQAGASGLEPILQQTAGFRYRFWNPSLMRLGRKAQALLNR